MNIDENRRSGLRSQIYSPILTFHVAMCLSDIALDCLSMAANCTQLHESWQTSFVQNGGIGLRENLLNGAMGSPEPAKNNNNGECRKMGTPRI